MKGKINKRYIVINFFEKDRNCRMFCLGVALLIGMIITAGCTWHRYQMVEAKVAVEQEKIAAHVFRLHILANSDSRDDQILKLQVRDKVLLYMKKEMNGRADAEETKRWSEVHRGELQQEAVRVIKKAGYNYSVTTQVGISDFPDKTYGDVTLPAGRYQALRILIGAGQGHNWWCVLYPNLCFTDAVHGEVTDEGKKKLQEVLDTEDYDLMVHPEKYKITTFFFGDVW